MNTWESILRFSFLGTDKASLDELDIPQDLQADVAKIRQQSANAEEAFFGISGLVWQYEESGKLLPKLNALDYTKDTRETETQIDARQSALLHKLLGDKTDDVLMFFLQQCVQQGLTVRYEFIPKLLDKGKQNLQIRSVLKQTLGHRGAWLSQFQDNWQYFKDTNGLQIWEGSVAHERSEFLKAYRFSHPQEALDLLQESWKGENASNRYVFICCLQDQLNIADEEFLLEVLSTDKSDRVKQKAFEFLLQLPNSSLADRLWHAAKGYLQVKPQKGLAKIAKQVELQIHLQESLSDELSQYGIKKDLDIKGLTQDEAWAYQIFASIPPKYWQEELALQPSQILHFFVGKKQYKKYLPAFLAAIRIHQDKEWAKAALEEKMKNGKNFPLGDEDFSNFLGMMQAEELQEYFRRKIYKQGIGYRSDLLTFLENCKFAWSLEFTRDAMKELAGVYRSYYYNKNELYGLNGYIHFGFLAEWNELKPEGFQEMTQKLYAAVELRQQIEEAFHEKVK
ncbi:MAG: DUF5691 domain-containing protein [Spirochaetota bacterium]